MSEFTQMRVRGLSHDPQPSSKRFERAQKSGRFNLKLLNPEGSQDSEKLDGTFWGPASSVYMNGNNPAGLEIKQTSIGR